MSTDGGVIFIPGWDSPDDEEAQESFNHVKQLVCQDFKNQPDKDCGHNDCIHLTNIIQRLYDLQAELKEVVDILEQIRNIEVWATLNDDPDGEPRLLARFEDEEADMIREQAISEWITKSIDELEKEAKR